jgi:N-terminal half of MaoC dehydratase
MNPDAAGTVYPDVEFAVDPVRVDAFRRLFGQGTGVPPTFLTAAEFTVFPQVIGDPRIGLDFSRVVHGTQSYAYRRPLVEGESLTVRARIDSIKVRAGTGFLTIVMEMFGSDGELAATGTSTMIERGDGSTA